MRRTVGDARFPQANPTTWSSATATSWSRRSGLPAALRSNRRRMRSIDLVGWPPIHAAHAAATGSRWRASISTMSGRTRLATRPFMRSRSGPGRLEDRRQRRRSGRMSRRANPASRSRSACRVEASLRAVVSRCSMPIASASAIAVSSKGPATVPWRRPNGGELEVRPRASLRAASPRLRSDGRRRPATPGRPRVVKPVRESEARCGRSPSAARRIPVGADASMAAGYSRGHGQAFDTGSPSFSSSVSSPRSRRHAAARERLLDGSAGGWRPLARASHPGVIGLAATLGTGAARAARPLPFHAPAPGSPVHGSVALEPTGLPVLWHDVVSAGGRRRRRLAARHLPPSDTATASFSGSTIVSPRRVRSRGRLAPDPVRFGPPGGPATDLIARRRASDGDLVPDLLRAMADEGPDLLVGWLAEGDDDRVEDLVATVTDRLRSRGTAGVGARVAARPTGDVDPRRPAVRGGALLRIRSHDCSFELPGPCGRGSMRSPGRPCRAGHRSRSASGEPRSRGRRRRPRRGIHGPRAATAPGVVEEFTMDQQPRRSGSLLARGASADARPGIRATCEDRHGRVDPRLAGLLLMLAPSKMERGRLLESLRSRIGPVAETWDRIEAGVPVPASELETQLGPFVSGALRCRRRRGGDRRRQE